MLVKHPSTLSSQSLCWLGMPAGGGDVAEPPPAPAQGSDGSAQGDGLNSDPGMRPMDDPRMQRISTWGKRMQRA